MRCHIFPLPALIFLIIAFGCQVDVQTFKCRNYYWNNSQQVLCETTSCQSVSFLCCTVSNNNENYNNNNNNNNNDDDDDDDQCCTSTNVGVTIPSNMTPCSASAGTSTTPSYLDTSGIYIYQWSLIYGMMSATMILLIILVTCLCCKCYKVICGCDQQSRTGNPVEGQPEHSLDMRALGFDPTSEFAFSPPAYATLPMEPPKYAELFSSPSGQDNPGFSQDATQSPDPSSTDVQQTRPPFDGDNALPFTINISPPDYQSSTYDNIVPTHSTETPS